ncbi:MAG TPA: NADPH-dependent glutamate synthase [Opitutaceae bacterium]|nr:NADPH-dependent glutamate synthase [Opitutaceae bacterium]
MGTLSTKQRLAIGRQRMPEQDAVARRGNFGEVNLGLAERVAIVEAERCLSCRNPTCIKGCPVNVNIPRFLEFLRQGRTADAARSLLGDNALPAITGRVCPQETQCECDCVRAVKGESVAIGYLERFVADWAYAHPDAVPVSPAAPNGRRVAVVGSGPAGLTAAGELAHLGYAVTVYEALHRPGGVLVYGIPEFRLPKKIVAQEVDRLRAAGVTIECNVVIGRTYTLADLRERFDAVFIANGAGLPMFMDVPGEHLKGVYTANEYLTRVNLMTAFDPQADTPVLRPRRVTVVGGGNVAMDAARTAKRMGAERVVVVYRRTQVEMPARAEEVHHAEQEGIEFQLLATPVEVLGTPERWVAGLKCIRVELGAPDHSGRRRPVPQPGTEFTVDCDVVVSALGTRANPLLTATCPELKLHAHGHIAVDAAGMTSLPGVFAGGDIVRGAATVILAMGDGKRVAHAIDRHLRPAAADQTTKFSGQPPISAQN